jgi:hypothetical protein
MLVSASKVAVLDNLDSIRLPIFPDIKNPSTELRDNLDRVVLTADWDQSPMLVSSSEIIMLDNPDSIFLSIFPDIENLPTELRDNLEDITIATDRKHVPVLVSASKVVMLDNRNPIPDPKIPDIENLPAKLRDNLVYRRASHSNFPERKTRWLFRFKATTTNTVEKSLLRNLVLTINEVDGYNGGEQSHYFTSLNTYRDKLSLLALWITSQYRSPFRGTILRGEILWREHRNHSLGSLDCFIHFKDEIRTGQEVPGLDDSAVTFLFQNICNPLCPLAISRRVTNKKVFVFFCLSHDLTPFSLIWPFSSFSSVGYNVPYK